MSETRDLFTLLGQSADAGAVVAASAIEGRVADPSPYLAPVLEEQA